MSLGLGLGWSIVFDGGAAASVIDDYFWELVSAGNIAPKATGTVSDSHNTWDLDGTDYMPEASPGNEGYWNDFSDLVTNGEFDADSDWTKNTGWTISGEKAHVDVTSTSALTQDFTLSVGSTYTLILIISNFRAGQLQVQLGATVIGWASSNGTHSFKGTTSDVSTRLYLYGLSTSEFSIDSVTLTEYAITLLDV